MKRPPQCASTGSDSARCTPFHLPLLFSSFSSHAHTIPTQYTRTLLRPLYGMYQCRSSGFPHRRANQGVNAHKGHSAAHLSHR